jgi:hypothetical protein
MMKRYLTVFFFILSIACHSQGVLTLKNIKMDFSGFVRNDFILDSRKNISASDNLLEFYPDRPVFDVNGNDINDRANAQLLNTFTRFGARFSGLKIGQAEITAYLEADFTGFSGTNGLRLRHAHTTFTWPKTTLLAGRTWHPTFIEKVYPSVLNENTGLPFQVFNRSPQIRLTHHLTNNIDFIAGAVYQFNYVNDGPEDKTYRYQRDAIVPNLHAQIQYYDENWVIGAAFDWKSIMPRTFTTSLPEYGSERYKSNEKLNTRAVLAYLKYSNDLFEMKAKTMYGQNMSESLLPGGYAVASFDPETGAETYTPFNHVYNWFNFTYGRKWKTGVYAGFLKNLGTVDKPVGPVYGMATDMDMIWKISPQLIYTYNNLVMGWELSITTASYGENDYTRYGKVVDAQNVTNIRNMVSIAYNF